MLDPQLYSRALGFTAPRKATDVRLDNELFAIRAHTENSAVFSWNCPHWSGELVWQGHPHLRHQLLPVSDAGPTVCPTSRVDGAPPPLHSAHERAVRLPLGTSHPHEREANRKRSPPFFIMGSAAEGRKHFTAVIDGVRESKQNWRERLPDLTQPVPSALNVSNRVLGVWAALRNVYSTTRAQDTQHRQSPQHAQGPAGDV